MDKSFKSGRNSVHRHTNNDDLARVIDSNSQMGGEYRESGLANFHVSGGQPSLEKQASSKLSSHH